MKKFLILVMLSLFCFSAASCGEKDQTVTESEIVNPVDVYISISDNPDDEFSPEDFVPVGKTLFTVEEGTNVLDATQIFCISNDIDIQLDENGTTVASMSGAGSSDVADNAAGWVFKVNNEPQEAAADQIILKEGDEISWEFVDLSKK